MLLKNLKAVAALFVSLVVFNGLPFNPLRASDGDGPKPAVPEPVCIQVKGTIRFATMSPSGKVLAYGQLFRESPQQKIDSCAVTLVELPSGKEIWRVTSDATHWVPAAGVFSPDGKLLAVGSWSASAGCLWDVESGKLAVTLEAPFGNALPLAFSPDGKLLAGRTHTYDRNLRMTSDPLVVLWDTATGKQVNTFEVARKNEVWPRTSLRAASFSEDGKFLITEHPVHFPDPRFSSVPSIERWDVATGQHLGGFRGESWAFTPFWYKDMLERFWAFEENCPSGAGRVLGLYRTRSFPDGSVQLLPRYHRPSVAVSPLKTGTLRLVEPNPTLPIIMPYGFPDGWEKEYVRFVEFQGGRLYSVQLSPDGKTLAATGRRQDDKTKRNEETMSLLIWDVSRLEPVKANPPLLTAYRLEQLWSELTRENPSVPRNGEKEPDPKQMLDRAVVLDRPSPVHDALYTLFAAPEKTVPFLADRFRPAAEPKLAARLIEELNSEDFTTRERATAELERLGQIAVPLLDRALEGDLTLDARRRIEKILEKSQKPEEVVRCWRAIDLLEQIGTPAAQEVLKAINKGGGPVKGSAQAAKEALRRLEEAVSPKP
jgi:WD40 repeat protein